MIPLLLALILVLALVGYCVVRASSLGDQLSDEIDAKLFVDPETLPNAEHGTGNAEHEALLRSVVELPHGRDEEIRDHALGLPSSEGSVVGSSDQSQIVNHPSKILLVPLEIEVGPDTRFPGIPVGLFENQLRMICAKGARAYLDGETLGPEPRVSVELLPAPLTTDH